MSDARPEEVGRSPLPVRPHTALDLQDAIVERRSLFCTQIVSCVASQLDLIRTRV